MRVSSRTSKRASNITRAASRGKPRYLTLVSFLNASQVKSTAMIMHILICMAAALQPPA